MAQPQLQIEQKVERLERALLKMGESILSDDEQAEVEKILRGEVLEETKDISDSPAEDVTS